MTGNLNKIGAYEEYSQEEGVIVPEFEFYAARIAKVEDKVSKSGDEHVMVTFVILDPAYKGAIAKDRWFIYGGSDGAMKRAKIMVNNTRKALDMKEATEASEFEGGIVAIEVTTNTYNNMRSNQVSKVEDIKNHPELLDKSKSFNDDIPF